MGEEESRVLLLYTGGTIGMKRGPKGYEPAIGYFAERVASYPQLHDPTQPRFTTFPSRANRRVHYDIITYDPLLDSANLDLSHYVQFASDIEQHYDDYHAFVIVHGTDTMAYSASALSFMLEGLSKPVVLTGSQIPLDHLRNDALDNLLGALGIAGHYQIPEVCLYFGHRLLRGCRATKTDAMGLSAFDSPNLEPLAEVGVDVKVNWERIRSTSESVLTVHKNLSPHVAALRLYPGITRRVVENFLQPPLKGLVLESYGTGNAPDRSDDLMSAFHEASDRGLIIVNVTQCLRGTVRPDYAAGRALYDAGLVGGADMTVEAALTKLAFLIGQDLPAETIREMLGRSLRGELTDPYREH